MTGLQAFRKNIFENLGKLTTPRLQKYESMTQMIDKLACPCSNHNGKLLKA